MTKKSIELAAIELLHSAKTRKTEQGVLVYTNILEMLEASLSQREVDIIREKLNHALNGIETHGCLTDHEFAIVRKLRGEAGESRTG